MSDAKLIDRLPSPTEVDPLAVREQLHRVLSDTLFRNSRRYPKLLEFVVEHTLDNAGPELKERTLGVDVFGRSPDYDTGSDPVVRITAAEVRKRLAQYYSVTGREQEIRISLPAGSYVPEFRRPVIQRPEPTPMLESLPALTIAPARARWWYAAIPVALAVALFAWWGTRTRPTAADDFWNPVLGKSDAVLLSVGQRLDDEALTKNSAQPDGITLEQLYYLQRENVAMPDVIALARLGGWMQTKHLHYRIRSAVETSLQDFRETPVVLVGAFTNDWNLRLNKPLRFSYVRENLVFSIRDREEPAAKWVVDFAVPYMKLTTDYALITRVVDPASDRMVVAVGGLGGYGTQAASEFLTEPEYMRRLAALAPKDWTRKNLQVVISTHVIKGNSGAPEIVSANFW